MRCSARFGLDTTCHVLRWCTRLRASGFEHRIVSVWLPMQLERTRRKSTIDKWLEVVPVAGQVAGTKGILHCNDFCIPAREDRSTFTTSDAQFLTDLDTRMSQQTESHEAGFGCLLIPS